MFHDISWFVYSILLLRWCPTLFCAAFFLVKMFCAALNLHFFSQNENSIFSDPLVNFSNPPFCSPFIWRFAIFFPLRTPICVKPGSTLEVQFWRCCGSTKVDWFYITCYFCNSSLLVFIRSIMSSFSIIVLLTSILFLYGIWNRFGMSGVLRLPLRLQFTTVMDVRIGLGFSVWYEFFCGIFQVKEKYVVQ